MIATCITESALALYLLFRYRLTRFVFAVVSVLALLATFQLAEYRICTASGTIPPLWARVGFVTITLLPAMGLYLVSLISRRTHFLRLGAAAAIAFLAYFALVPKSITSAACGGNYVIFNGARDLYWIYGLYYLGFLLLGVWEALEKMIALGERSTTRKALRWLIIGYLSFMAPMGVVYILYPAARNAVASVMCGFAIALAFILTFRVVPIYIRAHPRDQ